MLTPPGLPALFLPGVGEGLLCLAMQLELGRHVEPEQRPQLQVWLIRPRICHICAASVGNRAHCLQLGQHLGLGTAPVAGAGAAPAAGARTAPVAGAARASGAALAAVARAASAAGTTLPAGAACNGAI